MKEHDRPICRRDKYRCLTYLRGKKEVTDGIILSTYISISDALKKK